MHKITSSVLVNNCPAVSAEMERWWWFRARWLPRKRESLSAVVHHSFEDSAIAKMPSFGVNLDWKTQVLEMCLQAGKGGSCTGSWSSSLACYGGGVTYVTTSPQVPSSLAPSDYAGILQVLEHIAFLLRAFASAILSPWSAFPIPSPGLCLLIL